MSAVGEAGFAEQVREPCPNSGWRYWCPSETSLSGTARWLASANSRVPSGPSKACGATAGTGSSGACAGPGRRRGRTRGRTGWGATALTGPTSLHVDKGAQVDVEQVVEADP